MWSRTRRSLLYTDPGAAEFRAVLDAIDDPMLLVSEQTIVFVNRAAASLFEEDSESMWGRPIDAHIAERDRAALKDRLASPGPDPIRISALGRHGQELILDVRVRDAGNECRVLMCRDATEAQSVHETIGRLGRIYERAPANQLLDLEALLEEAGAIFDVLGWSLSLFTLVPGGASLRFRMAYRGRALNEAQRFVQGITGEVLPFEAVPVVKQVVDLGQGVFVDNLPQVASHTAGHIGNEHMVEVAEGFVADGLSRAAFAPVYVDGELAHVLIVAGADIAERDFAAVQLLAAMISATEQAKRINVEMLRQKQHAVLGQMSTQLAHEVRNPLAVVFQASRQIRRRVEQGQPVDDLMDMVDEESRRLERLVNDLMHFAGPLQCRLRPTDLVHVVEIAVDALQSELPSRCENVELVVRVDPQLQVQADPLLLRQAISHLLLDAYVHAGRGGKVQVEATKQDCGIALCVHNDGEPVPPELAKRLFEPFFTTKAQGSSLGLAVVRRLLETQGGAVEYEAQGERSTMRVTLPFALEPV